MKKPFLLLMFGVFLSVFVINFISAVTWDVSTATWDGPDSNLSILGQNGNPEGIFFNGTGTKMYMLGSAISDRVFQYTLSQAWNTSTATYDNINLDVNAQDSNTFSMIFDPTGTKMYISGSANGGTIYQYTLSQAWNLTTATWDGSGSNLSVAAQDPFPSGIAFNGTGTRMFILGATGHKVLQYTLSTPWQINTSTWDGPDSNFSSLPFTNIYGIFFKPTGNKMFILSAFDDSIHQYTLSTPWQLNTSTWDGPTSNLSFESQDTSPADIFFNSTGTKIYMLGSANDRVYQYTMPNVPAAISYKSSILGTNNHIKILGGLRFRLYL